MTHPTIRRLATAAVAVLGLLGCAPPHRPEPVVRKVDHVVLHSQRPEPLFRFFTETLGLPSAWPYADYQAFASGGVHLKNVNLEALRMAEVADPVPRIYGIVWDPYPLDAIRPELEARGLRPGPAYDQLGGPPGAQVRLWTQVFLEALCTDRYVVYLCAYSPAYRARLDEAAAGQPAELGGIGLTGVREIVVGVREDPAQAAAWRAFLAPVAGRGGRFQVDGGPAVQFVPAAENRILSLRLEVASLARARTFLAGKGVLGPEAPGRLILAPEAVQGLDIQVVQR